MRLFLELHDGHTEKAWTNLLALTHLAAAWKPEPIDISHRVRYSCAAIAYDATWQALQSEQWTDEQLGTLQEQWKMLTLFDALPETAALARANMLSMLREDRLPATAIAGTGFIQEFWASPLRAMGSWMQRLRESQREARYQESGTYEDETALMLYYCEQETALKKSAQL